MSKLEEKVNEILGIEKKSLVEKLSNKNLNQLFHVEKTIRKLMLTMITNIVEKIIIT